MKRELPLLIGLDARIGKGMIIIDEETETIRIQFDSIYIVVLRMDRTRTSLGGSCLETQIVGVMRMVHLLVQVISDELLLY